VRYYVAGQPVSHEELDRQLELVPRARADLTASKRMLRAGLGLFGSGLGLALVGYGLGVSGAGRVRGDPPSDPGRYYGGVGLFGGGIVLAISTMVPLVLGSLDRQERAVEDYEAAARTAGRCPVP
jgi:hypothetical protein